MVVGVGVKLIVLMLLTYKAVSSLMMAGTGMKLMIMMLLTL